MWMYHRSDPLQFGKMQPMYEYRYITLSVNQYYQISGSSKIFTYFCDTCEMLRGA